MGEVRLFLVRVWTRLQGSDEFRASVRPLDRDQPLVFSQPEQVAAFLKDESDRPADVLAAQSLAPTLLSGIDPDHGDVQR